MKFKPALLTTATIFIAAALLMLTFSLLDSSPTTATPLAPEQPAYSNADFTTVITVTSGTDPDNSKSKTCYTDPPGTAGPATLPCTLRRAMVEANAYADSAAPILIRFEIPTSDPSYDAALGIWKIPILATMDPTSLPRLKGEITIDATTQLGGRSSGPKIILVGPSTGNKDGFVVGDIAGNDNIVIRGLGFQNWRTALFVNTTGNQILDNWFGLNDAGDEPAWRNDDDHKQGSGYGGIDMASGSSNNTIQNNVFLGLIGNAASIRGTSNTFADNYIGTTSNGTVPDKTTNPSLICTEWDWLGGSGIVIDGNRNIIEDNIFAGLRLDVELPTIQPDAIRVGNDRHTIQNNRIGLDATNHEIGVCGRGIYLQSGTKFNQVISNAIVNPEYSAISLNDSPTVSTSDANTLRSNIIRKATPWPGKIGDNASPEDAIQLAKNLPDEFENFNPAAITAINGVNVTGVSGADSPCGGCTIEIFLDDTDAITEALQSLAVVTAKDDGSWSATLPAALTAGQGLRTTSTTNDPNVIPGMSDGTTTGLSDLYLAGYKIFIPLVQKQP
ncbi:MAG: right-handed parallel beta-helix repeat-containing protein [Anaerolineales bacterium]|nr:right-handed parallel beta-helix repeat-containing protein [Anaerolineales bacterium]